MSENKIKLWAHQEEAIKRFGLKDAAGLFFEPGAGKTGTAIHLIRKHFNKNKAPLSTLIFAPKIVLQNWVNEFKLHAPNALQYIQVLNVPLEERVKQLADPTKFIFITNYDALDSDKFVQAVINRKIVIGVFDECQRMKNPRLPRTKKGIKLADTFWIKILASGTPILNSPIDLWAQIRILKKGILPDNYYAFLKGWCYNENATKPWFSHPKWAITPSKSAELVRAIGPYCMSVTKEEALDLPPLVFTKIYVDMTPEQRRHYREMEKDLITYLDSDACVVTNAISKATRLQQIANGLLQLTNSPRAQLQLIDHNKLAVIKELINDIAPNHKLIIWANWKASQDELRRVCDNSGFGFVTLTGRDSDKKRDEAIEAFNNDESVRILIGSQAAGGIGINLTSASYMIYYSKGFSLEADLQSQARNYRGGSEVHKKITRIDILTKDTIDEQIHFALAEKLSGAELIQLIKNER